MVGQGKPHLQVGGEVRGVWEGRGAWEGGKERPLLSPKRDLVSSTI